MIFQPKKVLLFLILSLFNIFIQFEEAYSNDPALVIFIENIKLTRNENNHMIQITKKEEECFRFFPTYFSELGETEFTGKQKKEILSLIKYNFISWVNYNDNIQILNSEDHILTSIEKSQLVEKLKESNFQSLTLTENYAMYNILFNDTNYNGVFNILNICDNSKFYKGVSTLDKTHNFQKYDQIEFILSSEKSDKTLIVDEREIEIERKNVFKLEDNDSLEKIINDYSNSRNLFIYNNNFNFEDKKTIDGHNNDVSNLKYGTRNLKTPFKVKVTKDIKNIQDDNLFVENTREEKDLDEKVGNEKVEKEEIPESYEDIPRNKQEEDVKKLEKNIKKRNVLKNGEKELNEGKNNSKDTQLVRKKTNLREKKECKKLYKSINNDRFYIDTRPIISNDVYLVKQ
ncbi:unnamed protein product [Cryptosporidium hominis]|uniref:Uncharacterized protein n=1 Tax=Cryptosporidium hominis TaxID=237895 RepID=A0A0S4TJA9_CRYHO|nr:unnamed protein product [Cryptosporidium hominis]